jgi:sugar phosphate isomerase/epimerase
MIKLPIALQVYSVRDDAERDFAGTMKAIKQMGYDGVELAGTYGCTAEFIRDTLKEVGLVPISAHVPYDQLVGDMEHTVEQYITIGCRYIVVPYLVEKDRPEAGNFEAVVENIRAIGEYCKKKDLILLYHNHDFEFTRMEDGRYALDYLYDSVSKDLLQTELDVCWVKVAGEAPEEYIRKYADRCPIVHLKDFVGGKSEHMYELIGMEAEEKKAEEGFAFRALGQGVQNFPTIIEASVEAGAKWFVAEQDMHYDNSALEDARISREYPKSLGY